MRTVLYRPPLTLLYLSCLVLSFILLLIRTNERTNGAFTLRNALLVQASFGTFCVIDLTKPMPRRCRTVPKRPVWKNKKRRKHKAIVHDNDDDEDNDDNDNDDHWLVPRVTKVVEDEYDDDDATKTKSLVKVPHKIHDQELAARSCTICSHYKNILYTNFLGPKEMVVIEQPWVDIAETLPAALQRKIYGAD